MSPTVRDKIASITTLLELAGLACEMNGKTVTAQCPVCTVDGDSAKTLTARADFAKPFYECANGCTQDAIEKALLTKNDPRRPVHEAYKVTWTDDKTPKLVLPGIPLHDDFIALAAWITSVLQLDLAMPVISAVHEGVRGQDGHVEIRRAGAPPIRFEPRAAIYSARRMVPMLDCQLEPTDGEPYGFKDDHCKRIAHVIRLLCGVCAAPSETRETEGIIGTFLQSAKCVEGRTTHGTGPQRFEAADALQSDDDGRSNSWGQNYLIDSLTGEIVIRVGDLQETARRVIGSSLPRGWLDARIAGLGWERRRLDGHATTGREGRRGSAHIRINVYRGLWPIDGEDQEMGDVE